MLAYYAFTDSWDFFKFVYLFGFQSVDSTLLIQTAQLCCLSSQCKDSVSSPPPSSCLDVVNLNSYIWAFCLLFLFRNLSTVFAVSPHRVVIAQGLGRIGITTLPVNSHCLSLLLTWDVSRSCCDTKLLSGGPYVGHSIGRLWLILEP